MEFLPRQIVAPFQAATPRTRSGRAEPRSTLRARSAARPDGSVSHLSATYAGVLDPWPDCRCSTLPRRPMESIPHIPSDRSAERYFDHRPRPGALAEGANAMTAKTKKTTERAPRATCLCGCGDEPIGKKARYLPGHDARHHAAMKAAGQKVTHVLSAEKRAKAAAATKARRAAARAAREATLVVAAEAAPAPSPEALRDAGVDILAGPPIPVVKVSRTSKAKTA